MRTRWSILSRFAALVLAIPAAVLAAVDLADRMKKRRRAKQLVDYAGAIRETTGVQVFVVLADGGRRPLDAVDPNDLLEGPTYEWRVVHHQR